MMKQFIGSIEKRKQSALQAPTNAGRAASIIFNLKAEWQILFALLLLMVLRLTTIIAFVLKQL